MSKNLHLPSVLVGVAVGALIATSGRAALAGTPPKATSPQPAAAVARATGIGGIFFKANDPKALIAWYVKHLGFPPPTYGVQFEWKDKDDPARTGSTTWGVFSRTSTYFEPTAAPFMINYRVTNLDAVREQLRRAGAKVDEKTENEENGRFGWAIDPEGNRFELWEPAPGM